MFFNLRRAEDQIGERRDGRLLMKVAIAVRAGRPVVLRIPRRARHDIALNYAARRDGGMAEPQYRVRVHPCPPDTPRFTDGRPVGRWTAFSGGFVLRRRGCYPIQVAREGRPFERRRISFGRPC